MTLTEELNLPEGQRLWHRKSSLSGFQKNIDIDEYDVVNIDGDVIETVRVTVHTDIKKPFRVSRTIERTKV